MVKLVFVVLIVVVLLGCDDSHEKTPCVFRGGCDGYNPTPNPKFRLAFGNDSPEEKAVIKFDIASQNLILATDEFVIEADGAVKFTPCSLARFAPAIEAAEAKAITIVRSDWARLKFSKSIASIRECADNPILDVELADGSRLMLQKP